ncbi:MAG: substrate-binding domain-containing protein [Anaerolineae bacterium]|jgi:phosphate transport system substrate-binding protein
MSNTKRLSGPPRFGNRAYTLLFAFGLLLAACTPQPLAVTREPATLRLVTADSCEPLAKALATAYEESHPWVTIHAETYDSALGTQVLIEEKADLAFLSWLDMEETEGLWSRPFASDGIAVITHPTTPFTEISLGLLQEIYRGRVQEWEGTVLVVVSREDGSGTRATFEAAVLQGRDVTLTSVVMVSSKATIEYVASTPGSIGYVSTLQLGDPAESGVRVLPVEGILPTPATIKDKSYPLFRSLHVATVGEPTGEAREFAQWVLGPQGQNAVTSTLN